MDNENDPPKGDARVRQYPATFRDLLIVYFHETNKTFNLIKISKYIISKNPSFICLKPVNFKKYIAEFRVLSDANKIVFDSVLTQDYRVYIPAKVVEVQGVIIMKEDVDLNDIKLKGVGAFKHCLSQVKIIDINRNKKINDKN